MDKVKNLLEIKGFNVSIIDKVITVYEKDNKAILDILFDNNIKVIDFEFTCNNQISKIYLN